MTRAIADATVLHYLILIDEIGLLDRTFGNVLVPSAVQSELSAKSAPHAVRIWMQQPPAWVVLTATPAPSPDSRLGAGETAAIALAQQYPNSIVLTDDRAACAACGRLGIEYLTTLRILWTAAQAGWVDLTDSIDRLRQTNFRVSQDILDQVIGQR